MTYIVIATLWGFGNFGFGFGPKHNTEPITPMGYNYYIPSGSDHYAVSGGALYQAANN